MPELTDEPRRTDSPRAATAEQATASGCDLPVAPGLPGWTSRHWLVAAVAAVAGWAFFRDLATHTSIGWLLVLGYLALATGLTVASYLPRAGSRFHAPRDVCAFAPMIMLLVSGWFLTIATGSLWSALAPLVLPGAAVLRRTSGSSTCSL